MSVMLRFFSLANVIFLLFFSASQANAALVELQLEGKLTNVTDNAPFSIGDSLNIHLRYDTSESVLSSITDATAGYQFFTDSTLVSINIAQENILIRADEIESGLYLSIYDNFGFDEICSIDNICFGPIPIQDEYQFEMVNPYPDLSSLERFMLSFRDLEDVDGYDLSLINSLALPQDKSDFYGFDGVYFSLRYFIENSQTEDSWWIQAESLAFKPVPLSNSLIYFFTGLIVLRFFNKNKTV